MSDYFGALMRSSGIAIGGRAPAIAHPRTVEPGVVEIDVEHGPPAMPPRTVQTASTPQQAIAPIPVADPVEQLARPAPASAIETPKPALGQALVRAAMQWVAADPQQARSLAQVAPPRGRSLPTVTEETSVITTTQALREGDVEPEAEPPIAAPADPTARDPVEAQDRPIRSARPTAATPPVPVAPFARDEVVEISIGAIHVRVDAPAAQTVARAPATPSPRAAAAAMPPRNALSRRALRRI